MTKTVSGTFRPKTVKKYGGPNRLNGEERTVGKWKEPKYSDAQKMKMRHDAIVAEAIRLAARTQNRNFGAFAFDAVTGARLMCKHCTKAAVNRPRGLCWGCYYTPGLKEKYPSTSKYARRGRGGSKMGELPLPSFPTSALPGTEEKLAVMEARSKAGEAIFHPDDAKQGE